MPECTIQPESACPASAADWAEALDRVTDARLACEASEAAFRGAAFGTPENAHAEALTRFTANGLAEAIDALLALQAPDLTGLLAKLEILLLPEAGFVDTIGEAADGSLARIVADARRLLTA